MRRILKTTRLVCALAGLNLASTGFAAPSAGAEPMPRAPSGAEKSFRSAFPSQTIDRGVTYRVESKGTIDLNLAVLASRLTPGQSEAQGVTGTMTQRYAVSAELTLKKLADVGTETVFVGKLSRADFSIDGNVDPRQALLETPFLFRVERTGQIAGFEFARHYPEVFASMIRGLVEPMQAIVPASAPATWAVDERTENARYVGRYELRPSAPGTGLVLRRAKSGIALRTENGGMPLRVLARQAETTFEFHPTADGVARVVAVDDIETFSGNARLSHQKGTMRVERVEAQTPVALPATLAQARAGLDDAAVARAHFYGVDRDLKEQVDALTLEGAMQVFDGATRENGVVGLRLLRNYARARPQESMRIARALAAYADTEKDATVCGFGFSALAQAGHVEAQAALVATLADAAVPAHVKEKAVTATMDLERPELTTLRAVWDYKQRLPHAAIVEESIATNAYGAMGDASRGNPAITAEVLRTLTQQLKAAQSERKVVYALDALANVGSFALVEPIVSPLFSHASERVRVSAFSTFRRMTGPGAFQRFAARYADEQSPAVKREALRVAFFMEDTDARDAWAKAQLAQTTDAELRLTLTRIVGETIATRPGNAEALRSLLRTETDRTVRKTIYSFIPPAVEGGAR
jgi:hypothetical protein